MNMLFNEILGQQDIYFVEPEDYTLPVYITTINLTCRLQRHNMAIKFEQKQKATTF